MICCIVFEPLVISQVFQPAVPCFASCGWPWLASVLDPFGITIEWNYTGAAFSCFVTSQNWPYSIWTFMKIFPFATATNRWLALLVLCDGYRLPDVWLLVWHPNSSAESKSLLAPCSCPPWCWLFVWASQRLSCGHQVGLLSSAVWKVALR